MEVSRVVECSVRRGLGPQWDEKLIHVFLDDVENCVTDVEIEDMVIFDAKDQLKQLGYSENAYSIIEIHSD